VLKTETFGFDGSGEFAATIEAPDNQTCPHAHPPPDSQTRPRLLKPET
jgi:hypothetical protein